MAEATGCSGEAGLRLLRICQCDAVRQSAMNAWTAKGMATTCQPLAIQASTAPAASKCTGTGSGIEG